MRRPRLGDRAIRHLAQTMASDGVFIERAPGGDRTWRIRVGCGRPGSGEIGLIDAVSRRLGVSRHLVHRALRGLPRNGRPVQTLQPLPPSPTPADRRVDDQQRTLVDGQLRAVGLLVEEAPHPPAASPVVDARMALEEALDWAASTGVLRPSERPMADALLVALRTPSA